MTFIQRKNFTCCEIKSSVSGSMNFESLTEEYLISDIKSSPFFHPFSGSDLASLLKQLLEERKL